MKDITIPKNFFKKLKFKIKLPELKETYEDCPICRIERERRDKELIKKLGLIK